MKISNSKEDVSTYFTDGIRKVDFVIVYQDQTGNQPRETDHHGQDGIEASQESSGVAAAANAFK